MKALLAELERKHPTLRQTMLAAMGNVNPSHLYDPKLQAGHDDGPEVEDIVPLRALRARSS